jgi:O-antigen ligase
MARTTDEDRAGGASEDGAPSATFIERVVDYGWGVWLTLPAVVTFLIAPPIKPLYLMQHDVSGADSVKLTSPLLNALLMVIIWAGLALALMAVVQRSLDFRRARWFAALAIPIMLIIPISILPTPSVRDMVVILNAWLVFVLAIVNISDIRDDARIVRLLSAVAIVGAATLVLVIADGNFVYGRLMGRAGPNFWGMTSVLTIFAALVLRPAWLRWGVIVLAAATLLMTQNRTSLLGAVAGAAVLFAIAFLKAPRRTQINLAIVAALGLIALILVAPYVADHVLLLNDPRRGLDSHGTGRFYAWAQAVALFEQHPWLGVGYRRHEAFISAASSAHNAYVATLADMGLAGLLGYLLLLLSALVAGLRQLWRSPTRELYALVGLIVCYATQGLFETRGLAFANNYSLAFFMALAWVLRVAPTAPKTDPIPDRPAPSLAAVG